MAQQIYCDVCTEPQAADILMTDLNSGSVSAFCGGHYAEFIFSMANQMIDAEAETSAQADVPEGETAAPQTGADSQGQDDPPKPRRGAGRGRNEQSE